METVLNLREPIIDEIEKRTFEQGLKQYDLERVKQFVLTNNGRQKPVRGLLQNPNYFFPGLRSQAWHEPTEYPWVSDLEASFPVIRKELDALLAERRFRKHPQALADRGAWNQVSIFSDGKKHEQICTLTPHTTRTLEAIPGAANASLVYSSALTRHAHLETHFGLYNWRMRCHLGLRIPESCAIRVGAETRLWEEGKCLIVEGSFLHEVWNASDELCVVLILDVWHLELTDVENRDLSELRPRMGRSTGRASAADVMELAPDMDH